MVIPILFGGGEARLRAFELGLVAAEPYTEERECIGGSLAGFVCLVGDRTGAEKALCRQALVLGKA